MLLNNNRQKEQPEKQTQTVGKSWAERRPLTLAQTARKLRNEKRKR